MEPSTKTRAASELATTVGVALVSLAFTSRAVNTPAQRLLSGLRVYTMSDDKSSDRLSTATSLTAFPVQGSALVLRPLYQAYVGLVSSCLLAVLATTISEALGARTTVVPVLALLAAAQAARGLSAAFTMVGAGTPPAEQRASAFLGLCAVPAAGLLLSHFFPRVTSPPAFAGACVAAGLLFALLASPGLRWSRSYVMLTSPPRLLADVTRGMGGLPVFVELAFLRLAFGLTVAVVLCFPAPPALLLAAGVCHAAALRGACQAYLDSAAWAYLQLRSAGESVPVLASRTVLTAKFKNTTLLLVKAAVQLIAPGALLIAAGAASAAKRAGAGSTLSVSQATWSDGAAALGTWVALSWLVTTAASLACFRTGLARP